MPGAEPSSQSRGAMQALNSADYPNGQPATEVMLAALGFDGAGHRGGGLVRPQVHRLPKGTILLRFYKPILKPADVPGDFGAWWFTPYEYARICDYFGVDGRVLIAGRAGGKSALHGVLALLQEWYGGNPAQLSYVNAVRLKEPLMACYGAGAPANADGYARTLKPVILGNGESARQVYIHKCWEYEAAMSRLLPKNASTDRIFGTAAGLPANIAAAPRLAFEN